MYIVIISSADFAQHSLLHHLLSPLHPYFSPIDSLSRSPNQSIPWSLPLSSSLHWQNKLTHSLICSNQQNVFQHSGWVIPHLLPDYIIPYPIPPIHSLSHFQSLYFTVIYPQHNPCLGHIS